MKPSRDLWIAVAGLFLTFIGLVYTAHTVNQSSRETAVSAANDLRIHLIGVGRQLAVAKGDDVARFDYQSALFVMNDYIKDAETLAVELRAETLMENTLTTLASGYCPGAEGEPIAVQPDVAKYEHLARWANARDLHVGC